MIVLAKLNSKTRTKIEKIKKVIHDCCIGVDIIVGFPSENDEDFLSTYNFLNSLDITYLHVFSYSERENTRAILLENKVPESIKQERRKTLALLSDMKREDFIRYNLNNNYNILFESYENGYVSGLTENYIKTYVKGNKELINTIKTVKLIQCNGDSASGEIIH